MDKSLKTLETGNIFFDAYNASIYRSHFEVVDTLHMLLPGELTEDRGRNGYAHRLDCKDGDGRRYWTALWGNHEHPFIETSGQHCHGAVEAIRDMFGDDHHVTRVDSCFDIDHGKAWEEADRAAELTTERYRLKSQSIESFNQQQKQAGRTKYIGSTKSKVRIRIYEKGHELIAKNRECTDKNTSLNLVRIEAQVRPQKTERLRVTEMTAREIFGFSPSTRDILKYLGNDAVSPVQQDRKHLTSYDRKMDVLCYQYYRILREAEEREGGPCELGDMIIRRLDRIESEKKKGH